MPLASFFRRSFFCLTALIVSLSVGPDPRAVAAEVTQVGSVKSRVEIALSEKKIVDRLKKISEIGSTLELGEINDALTLAPNLNELRAYAVLRESTVKRWSQLDPVEAWNYVVKLPESRAKLDLIRLVVPAYAKKDLVQAGEAVVAMSTGRTRIEAIGIVAEVWARSDVPAALHWARSLPVGPAQDAALYNIRFIWVHSDPATAAEEVRLLAPGDAKNALTMNIAGEWAARDPQKAILWANSLSNAAEQDAAFSNLAESWADTSPRQAADYALQLPPPFRPGAIVAVLTRWATQDPKAAAAWAMQLPDANIQHRGLTEVLTVWASVDADAPRDWVKAITPAPLRDLAVEAYVDALAEWAPESSARMAAEISDPVARWQRVERGLDQWSQVDSESARQWLRAAAFPAENKQQWLAKHGND